MIYYDSVFTRLMDQIDLLDLSLVDLALKNSFLEKKNFNSMDDKK